MSAVLQQVIALFEAPFQYLFTAISGAFMTILGEIPNDQVTILHGAMSAATANLKAGGTAETAFTAGLNYFEDAEVQEGKKLLTELLQAFVTASAPVAPAASSSPAV